MRIHAVAVDYDHTIAHHGVVDVEAHKALEKVRESGRRLLLVTGRQFDDLASTGTDLKLFDAIVAENGALLYLPADAGFELLGEEPPEELLKELKRRDVPFATGKSIISTREPHEVEVLEAIRELGLEWQVIFNKGDVMVLPPGVNKATGLTAALDRLGLSVHNCAGIGDAENDHSFLAICEVSAAVGNALDSVKQRVDLVTEQERGRGVAEFVKQHVLEDLESRLKVYDRHTVELGLDDDGKPIAVPIHRSNLLIVGSSSSGKSKLTGVLVERLIERGYQVVITDPEGEHVELPALVMVGNENARPTIEEIRVAIERTGAGVVVNMLAMSPEEKVRFSAELISAVLSVRASIGRPHWFILDEAHHLLPAGGTPATAVLPANVDGLAMVTLGADHLAKEALDLVTHLYVMGEDVPEQIEHFCEGRGIDVPDLGKPSKLELQDNEVLAFRVKEKKLGKPDRFTPAPRRSEHRRHLRRYVNGDLGEDGSFFFTGPDEKMSLRAFNTTVFCEMAHGVDDATWRYHLERGDYSKWFKRVMRNKQVARAIAEVEEQAGDLTDEASRDQIVRIVQTRFSVPE